MYYKFPCGCSFHILEQSSDPDILPKLDFNIDNIDYDCKATWDLLSKGLTKGVFQLESQLGKQWTKKLKPRHIEHLAALGALLRPGCLRAIDEKYGCSMTELYCRRKNGEAEVEYPHEILIPVLEPTYGVLTYQEQAMEIAKILAGFTLQQADELRKAIGKKLPEEMAKVKIKFLEGAKRVGLVNDEQAKEIFGWIEKSQRYSFNKSHAVSYGINGYISAYIKTHIPVQFYTSWLYYAKDKQDPQQEIKELVNDAKILNVEVETPDLCTSESHFSTNGKTITFGISDIKGIGEAQVVKLKEAINEISKKLGKNINQFTWYEILVHLTPLLSNTIVTRLISVGALRKFGANRSRMLAEYEKWDGLTATEQKWIQNRSLTPYAKATFNYDKPVKNTLFDTYEANEDNTPTCTFTNLVEALKSGARVKKDGGAAARASRVEIIKSSAQLLENPPSPISDTPTWIAWNEENLLGIPITCTKVDACDISSANCTCKECLAGRDGFIILAVQVDSIRVITVKNGRSAGAKMAFITVSDSTCGLELIVFADAWSQYSALLVEGNTVLIQVKRDKLKDSIIVQKVFQI